MKKIILLAFMAVCFTAVNAQEIAYEKGMIKVDGKDYAKLEVKKENFGLTKSFIVFSLSGEKIITAKVANEFEMDEDDNTFLYYRVIFETSGQEGIFKISKLNQEKSFAKLIGGSGIMVDDKADEPKVIEFIKLRGSNPRLHQ